MQPIIKASELAPLINDNKLVLIDARTGPDAKEKYSSGHIEGAMFVDLETELSKKGTDAAIGGRHPLPPVKDFAALLGKLGIDKSKRVVVYDDKGGANAATRFWWMMRSVGHGNVQVLDGGLKTAVDAGFPMSDKEPAVVATDAYPVNEWVLPTVSADIVAKATNDPLWLVIDVREAFRYKGESEPIDTVAGHIPGAVNIPYSGNLNSDGSFLSSAELAEKYREVVGPRDTKHVIVHCGSGVTACHTLLAMEQAGMEIPNLYVGSWSEWSRNERPIATGND